MCKVGWLWLFIVIGKINWNIWSLFYLILLWGEKIDEVKFIKYIVRLKFGL